MQSSRPRPRARPESTPSHNARRLDQNQSRPPLTPASFAKPPATDLPWVRLNMPATAAPAELAAEIQVLHDSAIAGVEVGQGAFPNNDQLVALLTAANRVGIKISLSHGPTQNPAGYSIDDDHARKTLVAGKSLVKAGETFNSHLPTPTLTAAGRSGFGGLPQPGRGTATSGAPGAAAGPGGRGGRGGPQPTRATLISVMAYRCTQTPCPTTGPVDLGRASFIELTPTVTAKNTAGVLGGTSAGDLNWMAPASPAGAQWQLIAFWSRGVFAQPDPFSDEGYAQLITSMVTGLSPSFGPGCGWKVSRPSGDGESNCPVLQPEAFWMTPWCWPRNDRSVQYLRSEDLA